MRGSTILLNGNEPNGRFLEGTASGTLIPGAFAEVVPATEFINGRPVFRSVQTGSNGDRRPKYLILEDDLQGVVPDIAGANVIASGARVRLYELLPGDEFNGLAKNISGTSDSFAIGQKLMIEGASGKLIAGTGATVDQPFEVQETVAAITADTLIFCRMT